MTELSTVSSSAPVDRGMVVASLLQGAWRTQPGLSSVSQQQLEGVLPILIRSGTAALAWRRVRHTPLAVTEAGRRLQTVRRIQAAEAAIRSAQIEQVLSLKEMREADPILVKGWAHSQLYPEAALRHYTDIDLIIRPAYYEAAYLAVAKTVPADRQRAIPVDVQTELKDLPERSWADLLTHSRVLMCQIQPVRTLGWEDTLRLSCLHLLRHLGFQPLWLCDVSALVENLPPEFDWDYCLQGERRRTEWMLAVIRLANQVLGARVDRCPVRLLPRTVPGWMLRAVVRWWGTEATFTYPWPTAQQVGAVMSAGPRRFPQVFAERWPDPLQAIGRYSWPINRFSGKTAQFLDFTSRAVTWAPRRLRRRVAKS